MDESRAYQFVVFGVILVVGIVMFANVTAQSNSDQLNNYTLNMTANPNPMDTVTEDGFVYEFTSNGTVSTGHIPVMIGNSVVVTQNNLMYAIHDNDPEVHVS